MTGTRRLAVAAAAAAILSAAPAQAALFTIDGGFEHQTPAQIPNTEPGWWVGNDVIPEQPGYLGAQLTLQGLAGRPYLISIEFVGYEALWVDTLQTGGGDVTNRAATGATVAFSMTATGGADIVPFSFLSGAPTPLLVANGSNPLPNQGLPNFFLSIANPSQTGGTLLRTGNVAWLALDDVGAGPDVDHDDWVGRVTVTAVPEPGALLLMGSGLLLSAGLIRRRLQARNGTGGDDDDRLSTKA